MPVFVGAGTSSFLKDDGGAGVSHLTTTQRNALSGVRKGQFIFNTTLNLAQYYDGTTWKSIDSPPAITVFNIDGGSDVTAAKIDRSVSGNATIVIKGSNFDTTAGTVVFVPESGGSNVNTQSITRNSTSQFTVTVTRSEFQEANDPYSIKLENSSGLSATLTGALDVNVAPTFDQSAGSLGTGFNGISGSFDGSATDADGDTITYSISAGSLPNGLSINSSTGAITGTPSGNSDGTFTFTVSAATSHGTSTRQFTITLATLPSGGNINTYGNYRSHTFNSSGTFSNTISGLSVDMLLVAGGGSGGVDTGGGGGAGGMLDPTGVSLNAQNYSISIGGGAASRAGGDDDGPGRKGGISTALGYTCYGGGAGSGWSNSSTGEGMNGGSGGGQSASTGSTGPGPGSGTSGQGNNGGSAVVYRGGGGGGRSAGGGNANNSASGTGGMYKNNHFRTGSNIAYAAGGTGGWDVANGASSYGHTTRNGVSKTTNDSGESDCANNTGHGGHGANHDNNRSGGGGSGICVIRYDLTAI